MKHNQHPKKCDRCHENEAQVTRGTEQVCYTCSREIDREIQEYAEVHEQVGKLVQAFGKVTKR
jgi:hypothetical protein